MTLWPRSATLAVLEYSGNSKLGNSSCCRRLLNALKYINRDENVGPRERMLQTCALLGGRQAVDRMQFISTLTEADALPCEHFPTYSSSLGASKQSSSQTKGNFSFAAVWGILQSSYRNLQQATFPISKNTTVVFNIQRCIVHIELTCKMCDNWTQHQRKIRREPVERSVTVFHVHFKLQGIYFVRFGN